MAGAQPGLGILPDDMPGTPSVVLPHRHVLSPRVTRRRRFWLEFSVLPYSSSSSSSSEQGQDGKDGKDDNVPAVRFPQFGRLPPEIRLLVWEFALCQPRVVVITSRYEDYTPTEKSPPWTPPPAELPALMMVCREAYAQAKTFYERAFAWRVPHVLLDDDESPAVRGYHQPATEYKRPGGPGCWFNFAYDSVYLRGELEPCLDAASASMVYHVAHADARRVRYVACSAADLGVGELMASQLYARLFPIIDHFKIKQCLNIVTPAAAAEEDDEAATEQLTTAATIVVTQRNPSGGIGYESNGQRRQRLNDTEASCMSVSAADIRRYAGNMGSRGAYAKDSSSSSSSTNNNVCQQVWDQWTNSRNVPLLAANNQARTAAARPAADSGESTSSTPAESERDPETQPPLADAALMDHIPYSRTSGGGPAKETMRIVMVAEDQLYSTLEAIETVRMHAMTVGAV